MVIGQTEYTSLLFLAKNINYQLNFFWIFWSFFKIFKILVNFRQN